MSPRSANCSAMTRELSQAQCPAAAAPQTGHGAVPRSAASARARRSCSPSLASARAPLPPAARPGALSNWYLPRDAPSAETAVGPPRASQGAIASSVTAGGRVGCADAGTWSAGAGGRASAPPWSANANAVPAAVATARTTARVRRNPRPGVAPCGMRTAVAGCGELQSISASSSHGLTVDITRYLPRKGRGHASTRGPMPGVRPGEAKTRTRRRLRGGGLVPALATRLLSAERLGEVLLAGTDHDRAMALQVAHLDQPALDAHERPVAAVVGQPVRPAHGSRAVAPAGAETAVTVAPEAAARPLAPAG